ncbi:hypothetical protein [Pseudomonas syringae]|uniref:hypothetical protein n=1 Tax=Pseudomonas syringae TaxID=317 RepID=UPI001EFD4C84|nr:hypothetical protein [Pseudomonas syringae]
MIVKQCEWISKDAKEAMLIISDGKMQCAAFSHPCYRSAGDVLLEPLLAVSIKNIAKMRSDSQPYIRCLRDSLAHEFLAEVTNLEKSLVVAGTFIVELDDPLPGDISLGDMISFSCGRIDVIS